MYSVSLTLKTLHYFQAVHFMRYGKVKQTIPDEVSERDMNLVAVTYVSVNIGKLSNFIFQKERIVC